MRSTGSIWLSNDVPGIDFKQANDKKIMKKQLILHIPHSSIHIPFYDGYVCGRESLQNEIMLLTDWFTDDLFYSAKDKMVVAGFSRIFCDVERFADDHREPMAKAGMGVCYETFDAGGDMRTVTPALKQRILEKYYFPHHQRLTDTVSEQLQQFDRALILDCHSFSDTPFIRDPDQQPNRPDICIGTDRFHTPKDLIDLSVDYFQERGYKVKINSPYSGTIVPIAYYGKDKRVQSMMIEVNRKLYLTDQGNQRSEGYGEIKKVVQGCLRLLSRWG